MSIPELKPSDNGFFYAFWSVGRRSKRKSMGTKDPVVAEKRFAQWILLGGHRGEISPEGRAALTVADLWGAYATGHVEKETAAPEAAHSAWKNLGPHFATLTLPEIDQERVDAYEAARVAGDIGRPSKPCTVRKELVLLRACFTWNAHPLRKPRLLLPADVPAFELPPEAEPRERWLTRAEIDTLMAAARRLRGRANRMTRSERFLWLALETAARKQAILDLTWSRVDFEVGMIHYAVPGRKKTKKRRVSVPISSALLPVLRQMHEERIGDYVMDHTGDVWASFQLVVEEAGLVAPDAAPRAAGAPARSTGIFPHVLRHTAATHMVRKGVPLYDVAGILGDTIATTEKTYAKHCPGRGKAAVNSISGLFQEAAE